MHAFLGGSPGRGRFLVASALTWAFVAGSTAELSAIGREAKAADGVLEISSACAATGCFPGDTPSLPVQITNSGSYRLTSDVVVPDLATTAIQIQAEFVELDLNGFSVVGPNNCAPPPGTCTQSGAGAGIAYSVVPGTAGRFCHVSNGFVHGMGGFGISLREGSSVERVTVRGNGGVGVSIATRGALLDSRSLGNGTFGAGLGSEVVFAQNVFAQNGLRAISGQTASVSGGRATGGNSCDDDVCTATPWRRRYYLTPGGASGAAASTACGAGFHMASVWEILNPSGLEYDLARAASPTADQGSGPPTAFSYGWIRTGYVADSGTIAGHGNCNAWSSTAGWGTTLSLPSDWAVSPTTRVEPWDANLGGYLECISTAKVWCIED